MLLHLLNLPSLRVLALNCTNELNLRVRNFAVRTIIIGERGMSLSSAVNCFPNIQRVEFFKLHYEIRSEDVSLLTSINSLMELKFFWMHKEKFLLIKCPQLRKLSIDCLIIDVKNASVWEIFSENNPKIEFLELGNQGLSTGPLNHLPKLKILKVYQKSTPEEGILKIAGEKFINGNLEHLEIDLQDLDSAPTVDFFKSNFPQLRCACRKLTPKQWLIIIRKH